MELTVVDAFTDTPFTGNPAAIALVDEFPSEPRMSQVAAEMNLSETAFVVRRADGDFDLRWFTPTVEVDLCGHATLAAAHVIGGEPSFHTRSGVLRCSVAGDGWITMTFPALTPVAQRLPGAGLALPDVVWTGTGGDDWMVEVGSAEHVLAYEPDLPAIAALGKRGLILTARAADGVEEDFVSRVFGPTVGIPEDPVTGSAHCALAPYWAAELGRDDLLGYQASARGGYVGVSLAGDRVVLRGRAVTVSRVTFIT